MSWITRYATALGVVITISLSGFHSVHANQPAPGGAFTLQSHNGPVSLKDLHGKVVLMFFGFTSCADICPTTLHVISSALRQLSDEELENVAALFISVDPQRDTLEVLEKYTGYFHENIVGVTDEEASLQKLAADYGVVFERKESPDSALGYVINHTPDILIVDRNGDLLEARIEFTATVDEIADDVRALLASSQ